MSNKPDIEQEILYTLYIVLLFALLGLALPGCAAAEVQRARIVLIGAPDANGWAGCLIDFGGVLGRTGYARCALAYKGQDVECFRRGGPWACTVAEPMGGPAP